MFCMNCGQQLPPDAAFCPNCGQQAETPLSDTPAATASADETNPPPSGQAADPAGAAPDEIDSCMNYAIAITILAAFNCGFPFNLVLGIAAIVYADRVNRNIRSGDLKAARECAKTARTLCMIAIAVIAVQVLLVFFAFTFSMLMMSLPLFLH
jgi:uncharacterized membrane protein YvbJ